jgi:putative endonuclease
LRGFTVLERGFRLFRGEIDIIALDEDTLVFIEVKTRARTDFGFPDASVTRKKQSQIRKIALGYLLRRGLPEEKTACRFDVLSLVWLGGARFRLVHYEDAF